MSIIKSRRIVREKTGWDWGIVDPKRVFGSCNIRLLFIGDARRLASRGRMDLRVTMPKCWISLLGRWWR